MVVRRIASKLLSCACALALALATMGTGYASVALADEGTGTAVAASAPYACDNGWALSYSVFDNAEVRVDGVSTAGSGALTIPSSIDGVPVTIIGERAFANCTQLTSVTIPDTVTVFKSAAFSGTGLTSVTIPASVTALSYRCFKNCKSLSDVQFKGASMLYLGQEAFMYCSALQSITLPMLTSYPRYDANADTVATGGVERFADTCSIGKSCFAQCTALKSMTFDGVVEHDTPDYFLDISCFNGDAALTTFIWKTKADSVPSGTSGNVQFSTQITDCYYTLDFYNSEEDATALTNRVASVTYEPKNSEDSENVVKILSLINGTEDYSKYKLASSSDSIPEPPAGKVWGVADNGVAGDYDTLTDSYQVIAVDEDDLAYGWVSSPDIYDYYAAVEVSSARGSMYDANVPTTYIESDGSVPDVDKMAVYSPDGSVLSGSQYKLVYEKGSSQYTGRVGSVNVTDWSVVDRVDSTGTYRVHAENTENGTKTTTLEFVVSDFSPTVKAYTSYSLADGLGAIDADAADLLESGTTPEYNVVVPTSDWRFQLIGAGLAGAGGGLSLYDDGENVSNDAYRAHVRTGATSVQILGSTSTVPQSTDVSKNTYLCDWLLSTLSGNQTRYKNDSTPQALSEQVYGVMTGDAWSSTYGTTAVVVPSEAGLNILPIDQTVYEEKAPVFFTSDGALSSTDLSLLKNGGFQRIIVAGTRGDVSDSCVSKIASVTGVTPERVLDTGGTACDASIAYAEQLVAAGAHSYSTVAVADGTSSANVTEAAQVAALNDGVVLVCNSSRDVKKVESFLYGLLSAQGISTVENLYIVGNFEGVDSSAQSRLESIWSTPTTMEDSASDTVAVNGRTYQLTGNGKATLVKVSDAASTSQSVGGFSNGGVSYTVTAVGSNAFGVRVTSVNLGSTITNVSAAAFASCRDLKTVKVKSKRVTAVSANMYAGLAKLTSASYAGAVKTVGASAFMGCKKLATVTLGTSTKTVGKSAFSGCSSLKTLSFGKKLSKLGASAFYGCKKLKTLTIKSTKLTKGKIGAKAFKGVRAKVTVKVPKKKLKTYKKLFVSRGLSKKATFKKC